jgi:hypothetical protein
VPDSFATSADGLLFVANGLDEMLVWDGLADEFVPAGLDAPDEACDVAASGSGSISGTYYAYVRFVDALGNFSNLSPISDAAVASSNSTITYTNVPVPDSPKVARRQILRNTAGQTVAFYVDVDTADLAGTTFSSTLTDTLLAAQTPAPLFDAQGDPLANVHGVPPSHRAVLASHLDRMFAAGEYVYAEGTVALTAGSTTVTGQQTAWPETFAGRFLWVNGAGRHYEIESADAGAQTLTLTEPWEGASDPYASYAVRPAISERRLVYYSEAGLSQSWPAANALVVQEDGDEVVALITRRSFLYILGRRHTYKLTFSEGPSLDGAMFPATGRGVVNHRSWASVEDICYLLDDAGVYSYAGSGEATPLSGPIQDLFEPLARGGAYRVQWQHARYFHASFDPGLYCVRFFVSLTGSRYPRHALCLDLRRQTWWVEEFPVPIASSAVGTLDGQRRVFLGGPGGQVYLLGSGGMDVADPQGGTVRGTATSATWTSLSDAVASFGATALNAPVAIVSGRGKGQARKVVAVAAGRLDLSRPWRVLPDDTSVYQVGGVQYQYRTGHFRFSRSDEQQRRTLEILFEPTDGESLCDLRLYLDRAKEPVEWATARGGEEAMGFRSEAGESDLVLDLSRPQARAQVRLDSRKEADADGPTLAAWELSGTQGAERPAFCQVTLEGVQTRGA